MYEECAKSFVNLALAKEIHVQADKSGIGEDAVSVVVSNAVVYLPLEDLVDREKELERLTKEAERLTKEIARCEGMLEQSQFCKQGAGSQGCGKKKKSFRNTEK